MSVKKEASGRRSVQVEIEVPGTPEQVWEAIATGPGVSSWFVPTEMRDDGTVVCHMGPGMDTVARQTSWDPPRRFTAESQDLGPNAPPMATEWIVEARDGGTCIVRVIQSLFASTDDWDNQLEGVESGWPTFVRVLKLYLTHFRGQHCSMFQVMGVAPEPLSKAWNALTGSLGLAGAIVRERRNTPSDAPALAGFVESIGEGPHSHEILLLDDPAPGIAVLSACGRGGQVYLSIGFYIYGSRAAATAERDEPLWQAWMAKHFPFVSEASNVA